MTTPLIHAGSVTLERGSNRVTGLGTNWQVAGITTGDAFNVSGLTGYVDTVTDDHHLTLTQPWPGASGRGQSYLIERRGHSVRIIENQVLLEQIIRKLESGLFVEADAFGTLGERSRHEGAEKNFVYRVTDDASGDLVSYIKTGNGTGNWAGPFKMRGEKGERGERGLPGKDGTGVAEHAALKDNPHNVTAAQIGLGNVDNTADDDKPFIRNDRFSKTRGNICINKINGGAFLELSSVARMSKFIDFSTRKISRFTAGVDGSREEGGNTGSNFYINNHDDKGQRLSTAFSISRKSGVVRMPNRPMSYFSFGKPAEDRWVTFKRLLQNNPFIVLTNDDQRITVQQTGIWLFSAGALSKTSTDWVLGIYINGNEQRPILYFESYDDNRSVLFWRYLEEGDYLELRARYIHKVAKERNQLSDKDINYNHFQMMFLG